MFHIDLPASFKIGDTADCRINRKPARVTWRDKDTLVIEPDDARAIFHTQIDGDLRAFACGDAGVPKSAAVVTESPEGVTVSMIAA